jgi:hypothetical protein
MQKKSDKTPHSFMIKALKNLRIHKMYFNITKVIYGKLIANIILNVEKLK